MLPILYSFRRCPYAIRARMAIVYASINLELREVSPANKPAEMLYIPKGNRPVYSWKKGLLMKVLKLWIGHFRSQTLIIG